LVICTAEVQAYENTMRQWISVLLRVWEDISKDRVFALAGGVAYYGLLALFPAIAALVALYGLFADPTTIVTHLDSLSGVLPGGGIEILRDELTRVSESGNRVLSITFLAGLTVSLWSANAGGPHSDEQHNLSPSRGRELDAAGAHYRRVDSAWPFAFVLRRLTGRPVCGLIIA
jgi:uncharacterized BrkB/YihY/UPF0761 family membrane protein